MSFLYTFTAALAAASLANALPSQSPVKRSPAPKEVNGKYVVDKRASFSNHVTYSFDGSSIPQGLSVSDYQVGGSPYTHSFTPANVAVTGGYLELTVPGGQTASPISCGEVTTDVSNILYASVRTVAILTDPAGVCNGMFFYKSDTQESDIEWLSDANSQSDQGTRQIWFTNQDENGDGKPTDTSVAPPSNPTTTEHEYRIDWTEGLVQFFIDGVQQWQTTEDVPTEAGSWIWNNWSNGDPGWSVGPPQTDAVFKIKEIDMYYNTA